MSSQVGRQVGRQGQQANEAIKLAGTQAGELVAQDAGSRPFQLAMTDAHFMVNGKGCLQCLGAACCHSLSLAPHPGGNTK